MSLRSVIATIAVLAAGATLDACNSDQVDEVNEATVEQGLSTYYLKFYYSDATMTELVGERSSICTSRSDWGQRTQWLEIQSGSCEERPPPAPPEPRFPAGPCRCCYDTNGDGSCANEESISCGSTC